MRVAAERGETPLSYSPSMAIEGGRPSERAAAETRFTCSYYECARRETGEKKMALLESESSQKRAQKQPNVRKSDPPGPGKSLRVPGIHTGTVSHMEKLTFVTLNMFIFYSKSYQLDIISYELVKKWNIVPVLVPYLAIWASHAPRLVGRKEKRKERR